MTSNAMILECPNCQARFEIGAGVNVIGRKVRCSRCAHVWPVEGPPAETALPRDAGESETAPRESQPPIPQPEVGYPTRPQPPVAPRPGPQPAPVSGLAPSQFPNAGVPQPPAPQGRPPQPNPYPDQRPTASVAPAATAGQPPEPRPERTIPPAPPQHSFPAPQQPPSNTPDSLQEDTSPTPEQLPEHPPATVEADRHATTSSVASADSEPAQGPEPASPPDSKLPDAENVSPDATQDDEPAAIAETVRDAVIQTAEPAAEETVAPTEHRADESESVKPSDETSLPDEGFEGEVSEALADVEANKPGQDNLRAGVEPAEDETDVITDAADEPSAQSLSDKVESASDLNDDVPDITSTEAAATPSPEPEPESEPDAPATDILASDESASASLDTASQDPTPQQPENAPEPVSESMADDAALPTPPDPAPLHPKPDLPFPVAPPQDVTPVEENTNPELEAALGDVFASPPEYIDHRAPLGAPGQSLSSDTPGPVAMPLGKGLGTPANMTQFDGPRPPVPSSDPTTGHHAPQHHPTAHAAAHYTRADTNAANPTQTPHFASPDEISPDPALQRSHIDTRVDTPFATDFSDDLSTPVSSERRGHHVHADLNRRRAMINLGWFSLAAIVGSVIGIVTLARDSVVRTLPGAADFYAAVGQPVNTRGLDFKDVSYDWTTDQGRPAIDVTGKIRNVSSVALDVPTVVFVLLDDRGDELYNWASRVREAPIEAGGEAVFEARVPAPPKAARRLRVRFARKSR